MPGLIELPTITICIVISREDNAVTRMYKSVVTRRKPPWDYYLIVVTNQCLFVVFSFGERVCHMGYGPISLNFGPESRSQPSKHAYRGCIGHFE